MRKIPITIIKNKTDDFEAVINNCSICGENHDFMQFYSEFEPDEFVSYCEGFCPINSNTKTHWPENLADYKKKGFPVVEISFPWGTEIFYHLSKNETWNW